MPEKATLSCQFLVFVIQIHKLVIWQFLKFVKKLKIGNQFLVLLPFPGHNFQNFNTMGICETQFLEAF